MNRLRRDALVGITALLGVIGLSVTLMMFGEFTIIRPDRYAVTAIVPDAKGLGPNASVLLNGVKVGRVSKLTTGDDPTLGVRMTLSIDSGVRVPRDASFLVQAGLLGESSLSLSIPMRGRDAQPLPDSAFLNEGDTFESVVSSTFDDIASRLEKRLGGFGDAAGSITRLADTYNALGEELRTLVSPSGEGEVSLRDTLARINTALDGAESWLGDDELRGGASATIAEAREAFRKLGETAERFQEVGETLTQASRSAGEDLDEGVARFVTAAETMTAALEEIRIVAARVNAGEGTMGQLLVNPDLFRNMNDAAKRLDKALLEAQLLLEKYRREGVPIQF